MAKLGVFVGVYSVILLIIFGIFCYLMSTVNPPKEKSPDSRKYEADNFIYSNEVLTNDNVAYGLEKVFEYYSSFDIFPRRPNKNPLYRKSTPKIYIDKTDNVNHTKGALKLVTESMKHIKGLRRSINDENQQNGAMLRSIHLKIKDIDGHPRIEIKVVPEKLKTKESRKSRSSNNVTSLANAAADKNVARYFNNFSEEVIVELVRNETIVLDFADKSINLSNTNNTGVNEEDLLLKPYTIDKDTAHDKQVLDTSTELHTLDLLRTNIENNKLQNKSENRKGPEDSTDNYGLMKKNIGRGATRSLLNSNKKNNTVVPYKFCNITTVRHSMQNDQRSKTIASNPTAHTLVGLLIPEATATLPLKYHFIK